MEALWNPWLKPPVFTPPTDIEGNNKKLNRKKVETGKAIRKAIEKKQEKTRNNWDALA